MKYLFVYGTLKKGFGLNYYLKLSTYKGIGKLKGYRIFNCGSFPAIIKGKNIIKGEVYGFKNIDEKKLFHLLDYVESGYKRRIETVEIDGKYIQAYVYVYPYLPIGWEEIEEGEFLKNHIQYVKGGIKQDEES